MSVHGINTSHNATEHVQVENTSYETDRATFIGRGHTVSAPQAMTRRGLSNTEGSVLDPIVAIRRQITLAPEQAVIVDMVTGISDTHEGAISLIDKYQDLHLADRVFELAWTHSQVILRQLNASEADAQLYGRLANSIVYANPSLRADASTLIKNHRGQSALWSYAISGDLPIVLCQIGNIEQIELIRQMVQAHVYWRLKGLAVDLVIWNEDRAVYRQVLQEQIVGLVASTIEPHNAERPIANGSARDSGRQWRHTCRTNWQA
jgi:cyclic beta-1,2-glucan synthetase